MNDQSLEQRRAADALRRVQQVKGKPPETARLYGSYAKGLPPTILQIGLGQAMAMLLAQAKTKEDDPHRILYDHIAGWLCRDDDEAPFRNKPDLMEAIVKYHQGIYVQAQTEALAYMDWIKKFAAAYLPSGE